MQTSGRRCDVTNLVENIIFQCQFLQAKINSTSENLTGLLAKSLFSIHLQRLYNGNGKIFWCEKNNNRIPIMIELSVKNLPPPNDKSNTGQHRFRTKL